MYYIRQIQKDDCGFACLKMVLAMVNKDKDYLFLPQKESHGMYSYDELMNIGKEYGINFTAFRALEKDTLDKNSSFPFIATICLKNGAKHAIVVRKLRFGRVFYTDPRMGKASMPLKKFINIWDGTGLFIESMEKIKCPIKSINPIKTSSKIGLGIIQLVSGACAVIGVYFIRDTTPIYIPVIFLSLAIIAELVMRAVSYSIMKGLDNYFFDDEVLPKKNFKDYLVRFEEFKRLSLASPMNYILMLIFAAALITIVLLNDVKNIMLVVVPLILALFDLFAIKPLLKKRKQEISEEEENLETACGGEDFKEKVKQLHSKSYNYSYLTIALAYLYAGFIVATSLLTMRFCGISSFPYIIFYSLISMTLYKTMDKLLSFSEVIDQYNEAKLKLTNSIKRH